MNRNEPDVECRGARERRINRNNNMDYASTREAGVSDFTKSLNVAGLPLYRESAEIPWIKKKIFF